MSSWYLCIPKWTRPFTARSNPSSDHCEACRANNSNLGCCGSQIVYAGYPEQNNVLCVTWLHTFELCNEVIFSSNSQDDLTYWFWWYTKNKVSGIFNTKQLWRAAINHLVIFHTALSPSGLSVVLQVTDFQRETLKQIRSWE